MAWVFISEEYLEGIIKCFLKNICFDTGIEKCIQCQCIHMNLSMGKRIKRKGPQNISGGYCWGNCKWVSWAVENKNIRNLLELNCKRLLNT